MDIESRYYETFEPIIQEELIPLEKELTYEELMRLSPEEISRIRSYFEKTFPPELSENNFSCWNLFSSSTW